MTFLLIGMTVGGCQPHATVASHTLNTVEAQAVAPDRTGRTAATPTAGPTGEAGRG